MTNIQKVGDYEYTPEDLIGIGTFGKHYLARKTNPTAPGP